MSNTTGVLLSNGVHCDGKGSVLRQSLVARAPENMPSCVLDAELEFDCCYAHAEEFVRDILNAEFGGASALRMFLDEDSNPSLDELKAAVRTVVQKDLVQALNGDVMQVVVPPAVRALDDRVRIELDGKEVHGESVDCSKAQSVAVWLGDKKLIGAHQF